MSTMLEQAIIDAAALRETAIKNAESALIEKYAKEFKDTVEKLLEQEEVTPPAPPDEMSPEAAAANAEDPMGPTVVDEPVADPMLGAQPVQTSTVFDKVKNAFFDLDGDENELLTINFDGLTSKPGVDVTAGASAASTPASPIQQAAPMMEKLRIGMKTSKKTENPLAAMVAGQVLSNVAGNAISSALDDDDKEEVDEEWELEEEIEFNFESYDRNLDNERYHESQEEELEEEIELDEAEEASIPVVDSGSAKDKSDAANLEAQASKLKAKAGLKDAEAQKKSAEVAKSQGSEEAQQMEEDIELTEEELNELEESLRVDMTNVSDGYIGTHRKEQREAHTVAHAEARDEKKVERYEKKMKAIQDLQEALSNSEEEKEELISVINTLKEQVSKINLSNAKLLYTNKVLSSVSLNERQKNHIVENITKASSVSEAKTIYETLQSTVASIKNKTPKSLSEALNRNSSPFLVRKQPASPNDNMIDRLRALAGIKPLN